MGCNYEVIYTLPDRAERTEMARQQDIGGYLAHVFRRVHDQIVRPHDLTLPYDDDTEV